jgi:large subunit ribosomal protein L3
VLPGKKMAGHMGAKSVTTLNLLVLKVDTELGVLMVKGAVPGPAKGYVYVRDALRLKKSKRVSSGTPA